MPLYISLMKLTAKGLAELGDSPARRQVSEERVARLGGRSVSFYATLGTYDFVQLFEMPNDVLMVPVPGDVEPYGLDLADALGPERLGRGEALRLVAAAEDDGDSQLAEPPGRLEADPLVRTRDESNLVLRSHGHPPRAGVTRSCSGVGR